MSAVGRFSLTPQVPGSDPQMTQRSTDVLCGFSSSMKTFTHTDTRLNTRFTGFFWKVYEGGGSQTRGNIFGQTRIACGIDGNKRTAPATCLVFLSENNRLRDETLAVDDWERLSLAVAAGSISREDATKILRSLLT
jgi:hypothetical protein